VGKIGASANYLLEFWAAVSLAGGLGLALGREGAAWLGRRAAALRPLAALLPGLPALVLLVGWQQAFHVPWEAVPALGGLDTARIGPLWLRGVALHRLLPLWRLDPWGAPPEQVIGRFRERYHSLPTATEKAAAAQVERLVRGTPGDVLGEEMSFTVTTGHRIFLQPFEFTQLAEEGRWDQRPLLAAIRSGQFSLVVLRFPAGQDPGWHRERFTPQMLEAIRERYRLQQVIGTYFVYVPK